VFNTLVELQIFFLDDATARFMSRFSMILPISAAICPQLMARSPGNSGAGSTILIPERSICANAQGAAQTAIDSRAHRMTLRMTTWPGRW
jgi:hypothetical protein